MAGRGTLSVEDALRIGGLADVGELVATAIEHGVPVREEIKFVEYDP